MWLNVVFEKPFFSWVNKQLKTVLVESPPLLITESAEPLQAEFVLSKMEHSFTIEDAIKHLNELAESSQIEMPEAEKNYTQKLFKCSKCEETFKEASSLLKHNRIVHIQAKVNFLLLMLGIEPSEEAMS